MLRIEEIAIGAEDNRSSLPSVIRNILGIPEKSLLKWKIRKRAVDSRRKNNIKIIYSIDAEVLNEKAVLLKLKKNTKKHRIRIIEPYIYEINKIRNIKENNHVVITGAGPCGLFSALLLARAGVNPIIIERGKKVEERIRDVENFFSSGMLNTESNVQFGEGGAGTFSDGKLYTLVNDPRSDFIFSELVKAGAPEEILYDAKPHIGTDRLRKVVKNLRKTIENEGGEFCFETALKNINTKDGSIETVILSDGREIKTSELIIAVGHSARDTFEMLCQAGLFMEQKPFSMGVRIEHPKKMIDTWQFGRFSGLPALGAAKYKMAVHLPGGRSVYTFCMCPGGYVVAAASENGMVVTNGMSEYSQNSINSNSALLVTVSPSDFPSDSPLAGIEFQRYWEKKAFTAGGGNYKAPVQLAADFLSGRRSEKIGSIIPSYKPGVVPSDLSECLPPFVFKSLQEALPGFNRIINGFTSPDAVLTAIESRSSSPLRIRRGDDMQANIKGIYPAGEGAGYAGGIVSSAIDGIKAAESVIKKLAGE